MQPQIGLAIGKAGEIPASHQNYIRAIELAGGEPVYVRPGQDFERSVIDGLLIMGGPDIDPSEYGEANDACEDLLGTDSLVTLKEIFLSAMDNHIPILGICMGMQFINIMHGGSLTQHMKMPHRNGENDVEIEVKLIENEYLHYLFGKSQIKVMCHHHQCVNRIGKDLEVIATSEDGIVEAIQNKKYPFVIGVEWHPERTLTVESEKLFADFVNACVIQRELLVRRG